tara:strand:- start:1485 stop:1946 length:462 start_codon:yes stop_codon:yes gene_type:complete
MDGINKAEEIVKFASALQRRKDQYKEFNKILRTALEYEDSPFKIFLHVEIDRPIDNNETIPNFDNLVDDLKDAKNPQDFLKSLHNLEGSIKRDEKNGTKKETYSINLKDVSNIQFIGIVESIRDKLKEHIIKDHKKLERFNKSITSKTNKDHE